MFLKNVRIKFSVSVLIYVSDLHTKTATITHAEELWKITN